MCLCTGGNESMNGVFIFVGEPLAEKQLGQNRKVSPVTLPLSPFVHSCMRKQCMQSYNNPGRMEEGGGGEELQRLRARHHSKYAA